MIDFVVCEDNKIIREIYEGILAKIAMPYDFNYKVHLYEKYDMKFKNLINMSSNLKIYILDLELPGKSGIDIAREIREKDWESPIIILTSHDELELRLFKEKLLILDFISKFEDYEKRLTETINMILKRNSNKKVIRIKSNKELRNVNLDDIYYIYRNNDEEKIMFVTSIGIFPVRDSLINIENKLDNRFCKSHRACIINKDKVQSIDFKNKKIVFNNEVKLNLLSSNYMKGLREKV